MSRVRHGARAALILGVTVSVIANVLHAADNPISQAMSAWAPISLWIAIELVAKVPAEWGWLKAARLVAASVIAGIAAWVSYWHMVGVALRYGEQTTAAHLIPLTVDGLVIVAWVCLAELAVRNRQEGDSDGQARGEEAADLAHEERDQTDLAGTENGDEQEVAGVKVEPPRKRYPSSAERVKRAHAKYPDDTHAQLAKRLGVSEGTVKNYRPAKPSPAKVNGHVPHLEGVN